MKNLRGRGLPPRGLMTMGVHNGISTGSDRTPSWSQSKAARRNRVALHLPTRTIWKPFKRPCACAKKPAGIAGSNQDRRKNGRWLWMAVAVGRGTKRYNHENGLKGISFSMLPRREDAPNRCSRGLKSMSKVVGSSGAPVFSARASRRPQCGLERAFTAMIVRVRMHASKCGFGADMGSYSLR